MKNLYWNCNAHWSVGFVACPGIGGVESNPGALGAAAGSWGAAAAEATAMAAISAKTYGFVEHRILSTLIIWLPLISHLQKNSFW